MVLNISCEIKFSGQFAKSKGKKKIPKYPWSLLHVLVFLQQCFLEIYSRLTLQDHTLTFFFSQLLSSYPLSTIVSSCCELGRTVGHVTLKSKIARTYVNWYVVIFHRLAILLSSSNNFYTNIHKKTS